MAFVLTTATGACTAASPYQRGVLRLDPRGNLAAAQLIRVVTTSLNICICSTPLHVGQYLLDRAREAKKNLFTMAELFTGSLHMDCLFTAKLGLNTLIREAMHAGSVKELSTLVHQYGGRPVGSLNLEQYSLPVRGSFTEPPGAVFVDCTHDNELPADVYTLHHTLPNSAFTTMIAGACGSNRGIDELIESSVKVVGETRTYRAWSAESEGVDHTQFTHMRDGVIACRAQLNALHRRMSHEGYTEIYVDHILENVFVVTRHCPTTHKSILMVAQPVVSEDILHQPPIDLPAISLLGKAVKVLLSIDQDVHQTEECTAAPGKIAGRKWAYSMETNVSAEACRDLHISDSGKLMVSRFRPGSVLIVEVEPGDEATASMARIQTERPKFIENIKQALLPLSLCDLNFVLFRCDEEEPDKSKHAFDIPGQGPLTYGGLQGIATVAEAVLEANNLAHPICNSLRQGDWLIDYTVSRLHTNDTTRAFSAVMKPYFDLMKHLPRSLIPSHFLSAIHMVYKEVVDHSYRKMSNYVQESSSFVRQLSLSSISLYGLDAASGADLMAAGLPHFSHGWMRTWGRDTFIAVRGLLLVTGQSITNYNIILFLAEQPPPPPPPPRQNGAKISGFEKGAKHVKRIQYKNI